MKERGKKREKREERKEKDEKPCEAKVKQREVIFLLLQAFQVLYKW